MTSVFELSSLHYGTVEYRFRTLKLLMGNGPERSLSLPQQRRTTQRQTETNKKRASYYFSAFGPSLSITLEDSRKRNTRQNNEAWKAKQWCWCAKTLKNDLHALNGNNKHSSNITAGVQYSEHTWKRISALAQSKKKIEAKQKKKKRQRSECLFTVSRTQMPNG